VISGYCYFLAHSVDRTPGRVGEDFLTKKITAAVFLMALPEFRRLLHEIDAMYSTLKAKTKSIQYIGHNTQTPVKSRRRYFY